MTDFTLPLHLKGPSTLCTHPQVSSKALDLGTPEDNNMIKDIGNVSVDFSVIPIFLLHNIQHATVDEIEARERVVVEKLKHSKNMMASLKTKV